MVIADEGLAIETLLRKRTGEQAEHQLVRVLPGTVGQILEHRLVDADAVILQIVPGNSHSRFKVLIADGVAVGGQVFDFPVTNPLPHGGDSSQPCVVFVPRLAGNLHSHAGVLRLHFMERFVEHGVEALERLPNCAAVDNHLV